MANVHTTLTSLFQDIADKIKLKTGSTEKIIADNFPTAIEGITTVSEATADDTATAADLALGVTAHVKGAKITGTLPVTSKSDSYGFTYSGLATSSISGTFLLNSLAPKDVIMKNGAIAATYVKYTDLNTFLGLTADKVKQGAVIGNITGTYTSDATATANDILEGKKAYVNGQKVTGGVGDINCTLYTYDVQEELVEEDIQTYYREHAINAPTIFNCNGKYYCTKTNNTFVVSTDGINWTEQAIPGTRLSVGTEVQLFEVNNQTFCVNYKDKDCYIESEQGGFNTKILTGYSNYTSNNHAVVGGKITENNELFLECYISGSTKSITVNLTDKMGSNSMYLNSMLGVGDEVYIFVGNSQQIFSLVAKVVGEILDVYAPEVTNLPFSVFKNFSKVYYLDNTIILFQPTNGILYYAKIANPTVYTNTNLFLKKIPNNSVNKFGNALLLIDNVKTQFIVIKNNIPVGITLNLQENDFIIKSDFIDYGDDCMIYDNFLYIVMYENTYAPNSTSKYDFNFRLEKRVFNIKQIDMNFNLIKE